MKRAAFFIAAMLLGACVLRTGQQPGSYEPAQTARGIRATLTVGAKQVDGELLEVRDSGVVVHTAGQIALIPFSAVTRGTFADTKVTIGSGTRPDESVRHKIRMLSRFPWGIPDPTLRQLLLAQRQDSLVVVTP